MPLIVADRAARGLAIKAPYALFLPHKDRFQRALLLLNGLQHQLADALSPKQVKELTFIRTIISEGATYEDRIIGAAREKEKRLEAYANRRKRGQIVKPSGLFVHGVTINEIKAQFKATEKKAREELNKKELRFIRSLAAKEAKAFKEEWKALPAQRVNGRIKRQPFEEWLVATGKGPELWSLEETISDLTARITAKPNPFFIDIARYNNKATRAVINQAQTLERPLRDMQRLPRSDDSIVIEIN